HVRGITHDSRRVGSGDLYAALPGMRVHGAEFADQAARSGAAAIMTDPAGADRAEATGLPVLVVPAVRTALGRAASWVFDAPVESAPVPCTPPYRACACTAPSSPTKRPGRGRPRS